MLVNDDHHGLPTVEDMVEEFLGKAIFPPKIHKLAELKKAEADDAERVAQEG